MAGFTFARFDVERTIEMMKRIGVVNLSLKEFHMPLNSSQEKINEVMGKFRAAGINVYTLGVIYMKTPESVEQAFSYAKMAGVDMIVGAPNYELLPQVEKKVKETGIRIAIHNHGPDNPLYPNATDIWEHVKSLDPRLGICIDIGHTTRDGEDPSSDIKKYRERIFDIHIKDVDKNTSEGESIEAGRGVIDLPGFLRSLLDLKYKGLLAFEYEKDPKDPLPGLAESVGYIRGILAAI